MSRNKWFVLILVFFLLRLFFGLCRAQFWEVDQFQTYLIGLKCYTTQTWPWFGPDVNGSESSFKSQIPGALEGLMIGLPFWVCPVPEAPFVLVNLFSIAGVALLAWYIGRRVPGLSTPWVFAWIAIVPWSIHESTVMINPAFTFFPSILFFVGFMESLPLFSLGLWKPSWANAAMGLSLFWIMQFHFSYVYLLPLALGSLAWQFLREKRFGDPLYFLLGSLPMIALIVPTYMKFGLARGNVAGGFVMPFNWDNVAEFWTILARFFSLVSFELPRFIGPSTQSRVEFLTKEHPLLALPGFIVWGVGLVQPFILTSYWFNFLRAHYQKWFTAGYILVCFLFVIGVAHRRVELLGIAAAVLAVIWVLDKVLGGHDPEKAGPRWKELNLLMAGIFAMIYGSFWFTIKMPLSHIYFVFFPLIMTYSCYIWSALAQKPLYRKIGRTFLVIGILFQLGYAIVVEPHDSIFPMRDKIQKSIDQRDYKLLGERRPESLY